MTGCVIRILGLAAGGTTPADGEYVVAYDPDQPGVDRHGNPMLCVLVTTPYLRAAHVYRDAADAMAAYRAVSTSGVYPPRPDGKPNRPLTAYSVVVAPYPEEVP